MAQKGLKIGGSVTIDSLTYNYEIGTTNKYSNRLKVVTDASNDNSSTLGDFKYDAGTKTGSDYSYDVNGNLVLDNNKKISGIVYNYLNLPQEIAIDGKGTINYTYDAAGNKLKKVVHETLGLDAWITRTTTYSGGAVYESVLHGNVADPNDYTYQLQLIGHEEGRIRFKPAVGATAASFEYDYMLKDHLGNIRMVLTEELQTDMYPAATMEDANATVEETFYSNLPATRAAVPSNYGGTYPQKASKLKGINHLSSTTAIGPAKLLKVMAGDKFNVSVNCWWENVGKGMGSPNEPIDQLLTAMSNDIALINGHGAAAISENGVFVGAITSFLNTHPNSTPGTLKAYLNWILLDEQFNLVSSSSGFEQAGNPLTYTTMTHNNLPIEKSGYLYIYVSNATPDKEVFFDNLQVTHYRSAMLEETHYYPFGLTMSGISSKALNEIASNRKKFNGYEQQSGEFSDESGLEWYDYKNRFYDNQIGRFFCVDRLANEYAYYTPYQFAGNEVPNAIDLDGLEPHNPNVKDKKDLPSVVNNPVASTYTPPPQAQTIANGVIGKGLSSSGSMMISENASGGGSGRKSSGVDGEPIKIDFLVTAMQTVAKVMEAAKMTNSFKEVSTFKAVEIFSGTIEPSTKNTGDNAKSPTDGTVVNLGGGTLVPSAPKVTSSTNEDFKPGTIYYSRYLQSNMKVEKNGTISCCQTKKATDTLPRH